MLAKTLNCQNPVKTGGVATPPIRNCRKNRTATPMPTAYGAARIQSASSTVEQTRELMREIQLKPFQAEYNLGDHRGGGRGF